MIVASKNFRDEEYFVPKETLERNGINVITSASKLSGIKSMFGKKITPEILLDDVKVEDYDAIVLAGGFGATEYYQNKTVHEILQQAQMLNKLIAATSISTTTLANAGVLKNKKATSFYTEKPFLVAQGAEYVDQPVVRDGNVITARDHQAVYEFAEAIKKYLLE